MWPLLMELLPHFSRLLPMADKYLSTRGATDKAHETALAALAGDVRGELGQMGETQAGIHRQLREQSTQMTEMSVQVARTRMGIESVEVRVAELEKSARMAVRLLGAALGLLVMAFALLAILVVRVVR
jgi:hypothetical protein